MPNTFDLPTIVISKVEFDELITPSAWHMALTNGAPLEDIFRAAIIPMIRDYIWMPKEDLRKFTTFNDLLNKAFDNCRGFPRGPHNIPNFENMLLKIVHDVYCVLHPYFREYITEVIEELRWDRSRTVIGRLHIQSPIPSVFAIGLTLDAF